MDHLSAMSPSIWTAALKLGYVGCLRELTLNGIAVELSTHARQAPSGMIEIGYVNLDTCGALVSFIDVL
jgi:hypothetical protein